MYEDNEGAIQIAKHPISNSNSKHSDVRNHFLRELVERKEIEIIHVALDVLTPLSGSRQESVEMMERRISGGSYMCWTDFHNAILCCGFLCTLLISFYFCFYFVFLFYGYHAEGYYAPSSPPRAITPVYASRLSRHSIFLFLGYHT